MNIKTKKKIYVFLGKLNNFPSDAFYFIVVPDDILRKTLQQRNHA